MFRSRRRDLVLPQAEHARLAAALAQVWGNAGWARPPVPFDGFVRAVAFHDRGYGQLDADGIGEVPAERWIGIQRAGFAPSGVDAVVDLLVALHVRRLVAAPFSSDHAKALAAFDDQLPGLHEAAGIATADAAQADRVMDLCDRIAFDFCVEEAAAGSGEVAPAPDARPVSIAYQVDGAGLITLHPWPLAVPALDGFVLGFAATGYPQRLEPVLVPFRVVPTPHPPRDEP